ncbi:alpha/beta-hydrolase [Artomyces pyxidatus]|uniref:Alpha/beta-hydrolase n=1 Tax=Artomyces pyxidatus TaxID=48021 RepID=A0ACB8TL53_9AGAM|nr:alpha/beta-hydrolase [Artomyces pyxidatus]
MADDYAAFWYTTNSPTGWVGSFDPSKPTIILLPPPYLDSTWLNTQFEDPRLDANFNMIAFDARHTGKTLARVHGGQDAWTDAADLAMACQELCLPPAHVWAAEAPATYCALRFATLFPDMCLSVTLITAPSAPDSTSTPFSTLHELLHMWCEAEELRTLEHAFTNILNVSFGPHLSIDLHDELIAHYEKHYPPCKRAAIMHIGAQIIGSEALGAKDFFPITQPVLLIHGDQDEFHSVAHAYRVRDELVNARYGAQLYLLRGARGGIGTIPGHASVANRVFASFLDRLPLARSDICPPAEPIEQRMARALKILAEFTGDPHIVHRDPLSAMAFSCVPRDVQRRLTEQFATLSKAEHPAFSPLSSDGRPIRKYSERIHDHWFHVDHDGMSYAAGVEDDEWSPPNKRQNTALQDFKHTRSRAANAVLLDASSLEHAVIKNSLSRVASATGVPVTRFFRI